MALDPNLRIALADPRGNINPNLDSLSLAELAELLGVSSAVEQRYLDFHLRTAIFNDGDNIQPSAFARGQSATAAQIVNLPIFQVAFPVCRFADNYAWHSFESTAVNPCGFTFQPFIPTANNVLAPSFGLTFPTTTSPLEDTVPAALAFEVEFWCRKRNAGDGSHAASCLGFWDKSSSVTGGSAIDARMGLIGDGLGGYRFGSLQCPDGAIAGDIVATSIDANSVQPAELLNANLAAKNFYVRMKVVPATPALSGRWAAYLNGRWVQTFDLAANIVRGSGGVDRNYRRIEIALCTWGNPVIGAIQGPMIRDAIFRVTEDLSLPTTP